MRTRSTKARDLGTSSRITPFFVPMLMGNAASAQISMKHGFRGPMFAVASACASSNDALGVAYDTSPAAKRSRWSRGGTEATIIDIAMGGFDSMKALSTRNDEPERASRPFDRERDGFVLAEGAAMLVLEELEFARARGARIYAELLGYGQSADAYDIVAVDPTGSGVELALRARLRARGIAPRTGRLHQRARHLDADRRSGGIAGDRAASSARTAMLSRSVRRRACTATRSAPRAPSRAWRPR